MTLIATLDVDGLPTLIADLLVTGGDYSRFTYTTNTSLRDILDHNLPRAKLVGKTLFLDERTIVAFSGDEKRILEFFDILKERFSDKPPHFRPMQWASCLINDFNYSLEPQEQVSMVGFSVVHDMIIGSDPKPQTGVNWFGRMSGSLKSQMFGQVFVAGSGSADFRSVLEKVDNELIIDIPPANPSFKLMCALGLVNSEKIFDPIVSNQAHSWGGFLQSFTYDVLQKKWMATPNWAYLECIIEISSDSYKSRLHPKFIFFSGGVQRSTIVTYYPEPTKHRHDVFEIENALPAVFIPDALENATFEFSTFKPHFATILFYVKYQGQEWSLYSTLNGHLMENFIYEGHSKGISKIGLKDCYVESIVAEHIATM